MTAVKTIICLAISLPLVACVSNAEWKALFEAKVNSFAEICGKYRRVAANDEARIGMSEACLMKTKYQYAQINTTNTRYGTKKQFVYLSIQGTFTRTIYVYVENGFVKSVSKAYNNY